MVTCQVQLVRLLTDSILVCWSRDPYGNLLLLTSVVFHAKQVCAALQLLANCRLESVFLFLNSGDHRDAKPWYRAAIRWGVFTRLTHLELHAEPDHEYIIGELCFWQLRVCQQTS